MNEEQSLISLFDENAAAVAAEKASVVSVRVAPHPMVQRCERISTFFAAVLASRLADILVEPERRRLEGIRAGLKRRAQIYYGADLKLANQLTPAANAERLRLMGVNRSNDQRFMPWVEALYGQHPVLGKVVADIRRGNGSRDDAEDVERQGDLLLQPLPAGVTLPFTPEEIKAATRDAAAYLSLVRDGSPIVAEGERMRRLAYAGVYADYNEIRDFGLLLDRFAPDVAERFPGAETGYPDLD